MLIIFGSIAMTLTMGVDALPDPDSPATAKDYTIASGGKGANQALAAARCGARVALIAKISNDELSSNILTRLRREGVMTSGVAQSDLPTATQIIVRDHTGKDLKITAPGANMEISHQQVPDDILNPKSMLLLQTELPSEENIQLLERAKAGGTKTVMNLSPSTFMSKKILKNIDYMIINYEQAQKLGAQMGLSVDHDAMKIAEGLSQMGQMHCIITLGSKGAVAVTPDHIGWRVGALKLDNLIDHDGAEDVYCGTFAACIYAGLPFASALKRASIAGSLTCTKPGEQSSFPFLDDIEKNLGAIDDPQEIKL